MPSQGILLLRFALAFSHLFASPTKADAAPPKAPPKAPAKGAGVEKKPLVFHSLMCISFCMLIVVFRRIKTAGPEAAKGGSKPSEAPVKATKKK